MEANHFLAIIRLRWDKKYIEALQVYKQHVHGQYFRSELLANPDVICAVIDCLKETDKIKEALQMIEEVWLLPNEESIVPKLMINICWVYCYAFDTTKKHSIPYSSKRSPFLIKLLRHIHSENQRLHDMLLFRYVGWLDASVSGSNREMLNVLDSIRPEALSQHEEQIIVKREGTDKKYTLASAFENWYVWKSKALYKLGLYEQCAQFCKEALGKVSKFHHGNHLWVTRRMALSYRQIGDITKALHELERLAAIKSDWFIQKELAEIYYHEKNFGNAIKLCHRAVLNQGYTEYKAGLFQLAAEVMLFFDNEEDAALLIQLAVKTREEHNWKVPAQLAGYMQKIKTPFNGTVYQLFLQLQTRWANKNDTFKRVENAENEVLHSQGTITRILHEGARGDGFITSTEGLSIYFRANACNFVPVNENEKQRVSFIAREKMHQGNKVWNATKVYKLTN